MSDFANGDRVFLSDPNFPDEMVYVGPSPKGMKGMCVVMATTWAPDSERFHTVDQRSLTRVAQRATAFILLDSLVTVFDDCWHGRMYSTWDRQAGEILKQLHDALHSGMSRG